MNSKKKVSGKGKETMCIAKKKKKNSLILREIQIFELEILVSSEVVWGGDGEHSHDQYVLMIARFQCVGLSTFYLRSSGFTNNDQL